MSNLDDLLRLDLKSLQYFVCAAETGSFSQAALIFGVAQSVLSRHLAQLEALTKAPLFYRTGRGVELTELGQKMLPKAAALLRQAGQFMDDAASVNSRPEGTVRIGLIPGISGQLLSRLVPLLMDRYPGIRLSAVEAHSGDIEMMLSDGRVDLGLYNRYRPILDPFKEALYTKSMFLVARAGSDALKDDSVRFSRLADLPLAMPRQPNSMRSMFEEIATRKKIKLNVVLEVNPGLAMQEVLIGCNVYTVLPPHALNTTRVLGHLDLKPITHPAVRQTLYLEDTRQHRLSSAARVVITHTRELMREISDDSDSMLPSENPS